MSRDTASTVEAARFGRRTLSYVLLAVVVSVALAIGILGQRERTPDERAHDIAASIQCPACSGQSAAGSNASSAQAIRAEIGRRIDAGQTDDEIRAYFASRYGDDILLTPPRSGAGAIVWVAPVVALVVGGAGLWLAYRRQQRWETV